MKILIVVAHPDDEVLGCGGTIAKHTQAGDEVHIIAMADGITSRMYRGEPRSREIRRCKAQIKAREAEFFRSCAVLGIPKGNTHALNFPDQRLDAVPLLALIKEIERIGSKIEPALIYTHHFGDFNLDHQITYRATMTAFRPFRGMMKTPQIRAFPIPGNMNRLPGLDFKLQLKVDVEAFNEKKRMALMVYEKELREWPHPLSEKNVMKTEEWYQYLQAPISELGGGGK